MIFNRNLPGRAAALVLIALPVLALQNGSQDPPEPAAVPEVPKPDEEPEREFVPLPWGPQGGSGGGDPQAELKELFAKVERQLREIDLLLSDAGAGDIAFDDPGASGIDQLLDQADASSQSVIEDIDRILEVASQMSSSSSSGGGSQGEQPQSPGGESPLDQQQGNQNRQRENTPNAPGQEPQGQQKPEDQPGGEQEPKDGRESDAEPDQRQGEPPTAGAQGEASKNQTLGQDWGDLPVRVREVFRSEGGGDLPVQYRDWIDAYHRRLNRRRR